MYVPEGEVGQNSLCLLQCLGVSAHPGGSRAVLRIKAQILDSDFGWLALGKSLSFSVLLKE
jgi:hypothetical protein